MKPPKYGSIGFVKLNRQIVEEAAWQMAHQNFTLEETMAHRFDPKVVKAISNMTPGMVKLAIISGWNRYHTESPIC